MNDPIYGIKAKIFKREINGIIGTKIILIRIDQTERYPFRVTIIGKVYIKIDRFAIR